MAIFFVKSRHIQQKISQNEFEFFVAISNENEASTNFNYLSNHFSIGLIKHFKRKLLRILLGALF